MFNRMREKYLLFIGGLVFIISVTILAFVWWQNKKEIALIQNNHSRSLLNAVCQNVKNEYQSIESFRKGVLNARKNELKSLVETVISHLQDTYAEYEAGNLSQSQAIEHARKFIRQSRYDEGVGYFWINDTQRPYPKMIMHPTSPELEGKIMDDPEYNCALGIGESLFKAFLDVCLTDGEGFVDYLWPKPIGEGLSAKQPKISYVRLFKPWAWIIGSGLYIDDIDTICRKRLNEVIEELRNTAKNTVLGESGYMFIFNSEKNILVHPEFQDQNQTYIINPDTGNPIFDEIIYAEQKGLDYHDYRWRKKPGFDSPYYLKRTYFKYFKPLGWYICLSFYFDEINQPAKDLSIKILMISLIFITISLLIAFILSRSITDPLDKLVDAAVKVERDGPKGVYIPVAGTYETKELGLVLQKMIDTLYEKESVLQEKKKNLSIMLKSIGDAVISTNKDCEVELMNPVAEELTGYKLEEAYGKTIEEIMTLKDGSKGNTIENPCRKAISSGSVESLQGDAVLISKNENEYSIADSASAMKNNNDEIIGAVIVFRDVSENLIMERELRQSEKMQAIGQLAGGVAHDFNNMLSGIIGASEVIKKEKLSDRSEQQLELIIKTVDRASDLVSKLLTFSKKGKNAFINVDIHKVIDESLIILKHTINKKVSIIHNYYADKHQVHGDYTQLQNMIINLAINASDAMSDGGVLTFLTENISLDSEDHLNSGFNIIKGEYIKISVRDTGSGIPKNIINNIFEPFFSTKDQGKGTGLGLSAVYGTVKEHNGSINVASDEGEGTIFDILLPIAEIEINAQEISNAVSENIRKGTILFVDDEEIIRLSAAEILEDAGHTLYTAENGKTGVDLFKKYQDKIDLVVLDLMMPVMNGSEAFVEMKKINPAIKIIISSGYAKDDVVENLEKLGLAGFLKKPFRSNVLESLIQKALL